MCGIAILAGAGFTDPQLGGMLEVMAGRGPDGSAQWIDRDAGIRLGHVRLAIIDLATGSQPMSSPDGRHVIVFNGEIYNYLELRGDLEARGWHFATNSDTEVLLAGLIHDGPAFLAKTIGMFALALWDRTARSLFVARDRMGIKPLYMAETAQGIAFASEIKALRLLPGVSKEVDVAALDAFLTLRYIPAPFTLLKGIRKFPPAHHLTLVEGKRSMARWWDVRFGADPVSPAHDVEERLDWLLRDSVRMCLRSDVPVGAFLSGGVDSGLVATLMAQLEANPIHTFSIGFQSASDERSDARRVAATLQSRHTELELVPDDLRRLPDVTYLFDEPFPDPIVLAMGLLAEEARKSVKVVLTGEGADELFAGYVHHPHLKLLDRLAGFLPPGVPRILGAIAGKTPAALVNRFFSYSAPLAGRDVERLGNLLANARSPVGRYLAYVSLFEPAERERLIAQKSQEAGAAVAAVTGCLETSSGNYLDRLLSCEYRYWLADNILLKQDKTLMAFGVEGRVPFCDHRLVEFAMALPHGARLGGGQNKLALRRAAGRLAPQLPRSGAKKAFMIPMDGGYGRVIREIAGDVLTSSHFRGTGLFESGYIDALIAGFPSQSIVAGKQLLALTMLGLWLEGQSRNRVKLVTG